MTMSCHSKGAMNESDDERELTSLTWLMELRNQNFSWPNVMHPATLDDDTKNGQSNKAAAEEDCRQQELYAEATNKDCANSENNAGTPNIGALSNEAGLNKNDKRRTDGDAATDKINSGDEKSAKPLWNGKCIEKPSKKPTNVVAQTQQPQIQLKRATPAERYEIFLEKVKRDFEEYEKSAVNYQTDTMEKPPFNYSHIIGMAMLENGRVTLQQICAWIEKKFAFFRVRKKWNNSIRHNLSLHQCFRKIDRKKFEKGKGGYWELGVDPRKSDRKRIRNRKGAQYRNRHQQQTQQQQPTAIFNMNKSGTTPAATTTATAEQHTATYSNTFESLQYQQNQTNASVYDELPKLRIGSCYSDCSPQKPTASANAASDECSEHANEHLLLDELDIQQNVDVVSCCQQRQPAQDIFIGGILECNTSDPSATTLSNVSGDGSEQTIELLQSHQQLRQYQLGTIIISKTTSNTGDIPNFAATTGSINCFINGEYVNEKQHEQQQNFIFINDEGIPTSCENILVSSYLDKEESSNKFPKVSNCQTNEQSRRIMNCNPDLTTNTITKLTTKCLSPVLINGNENEKKDASAYSPRPNVIVEHLVQPSGYVTASPMATTTATTTLTTHTTDFGNYGTIFNAQQHQNQQIMAIDNIRPYIDGIEEAFQYLRSMDNNREDILDNFLDISVSDY